MQVRTGGVGESVEGGTATSGRGEHRHPTGDGGEQQGVATETKVGVHEQWNGDGE